MQILFMKTTLFRDIVSALLKWQLISMILKSRKQLANPWN